MASPSPTDRRRRQVRWAKRVRRLGLAWGNALEIARAGRLTAAYSAPFEVLHEERVYRLRRYTRETKAGAPVAPLLLIPPLMVASEVYDISPDVSAIAVLARAGVDVWLCDFGAPEHEEGGTSRTLDDHVRAVVDAITRTWQLTGREVHVAGYSQGGMFAYQAAAFLSREGRDPHLASLVTMGSPVDLHRQLAVDEDVTERLVAGLRGALTWPLAHIESLPGKLLATGFKVLSAKKEAMQLLDFVKNLHDRKALEKREAKRLFLGGEGFVAWPGPAFRKFVDEVIVGNRMASGGFVVDGHTTTLADLACPILYFVGSRDEMGRPASVRGIRRAAPKVRQMYEVPLRAGHFGLVVGSTALGVTWPGVIAWMKWREGTGPLPETAIDVRQAIAHEAFAKPAPAEHDDEHDDDDGGEHDESALALARELAHKTAKAALDRVGELSEDLGSYLDHARWQLPRLQRLRMLRDDTVISPSKTLAEQARKIGDKTFFLFRGRAFTYAEANRRVDAVVRGLLASGVRSGQRVGVMMKSRPSHLSLVTALGRLGAVAVLLSPALSDAVLPRALALGEIEVLVADPDAATRARANHTGPVLVLGGVGEVPWQPGQPRTLPEGVVDLEAIDPAVVVLPAWYKPDAGRARDLAMVFITANAYDEPRAQRITNRRWAFSALGAAAATTLTTRDTVYCCLPLHHPSGTLVAVGSALVGGARLALASAFEPATLWDEVRRYGASVVFYAGDLCRRLVDAPRTVGEANHPVRLFAGSGMRVDVWKRLVERFGGTSIVELYASTEAHVVLANAAGKKVGSVGRPLPGSPDVAIAAWDFTADELVRDGRGHLVHARLDEPGMLIAKMSARAGADVAHIDPRRLIHDAFEPGDTWFVTGDLFRVDVSGDYWFVDRQGQTIQTKRGMVASTQIEDAVYACPGVVSCVAVGRPDPEAGAGLRYPVAAIVVKGAVNVVALSAAVVALPEYARPQRIRVVAELPQTDGYRPIKAAVRDLDFGHADALRWDARKLTYESS